MAKATQKDIASAVQACVRMGERGKAALVRCAHDELHEKLGRGYGGSAGSGVDGKILRAAATAVTTRRR